MPYSARNLWIKAAIVASAVVVASGPVAMAAGRKSTGSKSSAREKKATDANDCSNFLVVRAHTEHGSNNDIEIEERAQAMAAALIEASRDSGLKIDFNATAENLGREVEELLGDHRANRLLDTSLAELNKSAEAAKKGDGEAPATISDVLNALSALNAGPGGFYNGIRSLRNMPLIGNRIGKLIVEQTADRMQTAKQAIDAMIASLDNQKKQLENVNIELEREIDRNSSGLVKLEYSLALSHRLLELVKEGYKEAQAQQNHVLMNNLDKFIRMLLERINTLQQLEMTGQTMIAVLEQKIVHNRQAIQQIHRVKTVSIPVTVGSAIVEASSAKLEEALRTTRTLDRHNRAMFDKIQTDLGRQGEDLRQQRVESLATPDQMAKVIEAVSREVVAQQLSDRAYQAELERKIELRHMAIARADEIRRSIHSSEEPLLLEVARDEFADEIEELSAASLQIPSEAATVGDNK